jgi:hypothetical protein
LADKVRNVAIDRSFGDLELGGERVGSYRSRRPAQDLNDLKKPLGASHGPLSRDDADSMMAAEWQQRRWRMRDSLPNNLAGN